MISYKYSNCESSKSKTKERNKVINSIAKILNNITTNNYNNSSSLYTNYLPLIFNLLVIIT